MVKRIRDYGIRIGRLKTGEKNKITDVKGIKVGHVTLNHGNIKTGVTAILPHDGNLFKEKVIAASYVLNGFGKTIGTIQINELGTIETPIILTNTLSIGIAAEALIEYMLKNNKDIGYTTGTINPVVCECNDGFLNDIRGMHIKKEHIFEAINNACENFEEGAVGAGTGMSCFSLKGGIGSASRRFYIKDKEYIIGALVLSNFGVKEDFLLDGRKAGELIKKIDKRTESQKEKGSIIVILATDAPMSERQLKRLCKRGGAGIIRTGSYLGNGSGDIIIAFTTKNKINHYEQDGEISIKILNDNMIDIAFRGAVEAVEEAILNSLICAETTEGRDGNIRYSLKNYIEKII
ncbi:D-aminopeptidase [Caminicella sporogenes DSM 14501]|uniref:D-aminopeptidase n=1 Tax=Caminicella sporogenes DSM 14501 TaxID=1121266 RepID=A0A1M6PBI0_9FIRM|nr:P1 family peptidase [Caminicella sporogenes]RKD21462.1 aminopeptidase [Caminicella sporogenes]SHK05296.1 D-aminopeptidase [Caminicella sporogenes DSM 14501]